MLMSLLFLLEGALSPGSFAVFRSHLVEKRNLILDRKDSVFNHHRSRVITFDRHLKAAPSKTKLNVLYIDTSIFFLLQQVEELVDERKQLEDACARLKRYVDVIRDL